MIELLYSVQAILTPVCLLATVVVLYKAIKLMQK